MFANRLSATAALPARGSTFAAGVDLARWHLALLVCPQHDSTGLILFVYTPPPFFSAHDVVVPARGKTIAKTDLAVAMPFDCYARIGELAAFNGKTLATTP